MPRIAMPDDARPAPDTPADRPRTAPDFASWAAATAFCLLTAFAAAGQFGNQPGYPTCHGGTVAGVRAELLLGRNTGDRLSVTADNFQAFLDREVTPRFPDGFTVYDASGQWLEAAASSTAREPSYALMFVMREAGQAHGHLSAIAEAYKRQFNQQSVLVSVSPTCFAM